MPFVRGLDLGLRFAALKSLEYGFAVGGMTKRNYTYQYGSKLEDGISRLVSHQPTTCSNFLGPKAHTMAYSRLFPKDTPTRSPFFTPALSSPRASALLFVSRAS